MKQDAINNRNILYAIRQQLLVGAISYDEAKRQAMPIIDQINDRSREIAKKHGMKPQLVTFGSIMR